MPGPEDYEFYDEWLYQTMMNTTSVLMIMKKRVVSKNMVTLSISMTLMIQMILISPIKPEIHINGFILLRTLGFHLGLKSAQFFSGT